MKKFGIGGIVVVMCVVLFIFFVWKQKEEKRMLAERTPIAEEMQQEQTTEETSSATHDDEDTHYHAGFHIVVNGEVQDYSGIQYMHLSPCSVDHEETESDAEPTDPKERIHLHNNVGSVAHIHASGVTWRELFTSLGLTSLLDLPLTVRNSSLQPVPNGLDAIVEPYESVIFEFGTTTVSDTELRSLIVPKEEILEAEAQVEACGKT